MRKNLIIILFLPFSVFAQKRMLDSSANHLRQTDSVEWDEFRRMSVKRELILQFPAHTNLSEQTLILRQYDVKQIWRILINNKLIDSLVADGNDMRTYFRIPAGILREGENMLSILPAS